MHPAEPSTSNARRLCPASAELPSGGVTTAAPGAATPSTEGVHVVWNDRPSFRVGEVFREAIRVNCASIIVVHNHPSGDPTPSAEDVKLTESLVAAGQLLDIEVLDHLVLGHQRFISLRERRLGFA